MLTLLQKRTRLAKRTLAALVAARGGDLVVHLEDRRPSSSAAAQPSLALANPIAADLSDMRPSLVPGLVAAAERNARRGSDRRRAIRGRPDLPGRPARTDQRIAAAAVRRGRAKAGGEGRHWSGGGAVDVFDAKRDAMALLAALGVANAAQVVPGGPAFLHPGRSATLQFGPKNVVGWFGQLHPSACEALDAEGPIVAFEIVLDAVPAPKAKAAKTKPKLERSDFMPVERDLAFLVDRTVRGRRHCEGRAERRAGARRRTSASSTSTRARACRRAEIGRDQVTLQPRERTLTDAEIEAAIAKIVAEVSKRTGATLRG